jgi:hypothetical protein
MSETIEWDMETAKLELKVAIDKVTTGVIKGVELGALMIQSEVQRNAPVDTGQYRAGIHTTPSEITEDSITVSIGSPMPQACRLEFGYVGPDTLGRTFSQPPRPHWRPAFDNSVQKVTDIITQEIRKEKGE